MPYVRVMFEADSAKLAAQLAKEGSVAMLGARLSLILQTGEATLENITTLEEIYGISIPRATKVTQVVSKKAAKPRRKKQ